MLPKDDGSLEESCLIIELKYAHSKTQVEIKLEEAKEQSDKKYDLVKSFTNKRTAKFLVMVFDKTAENADELIMASTKDFIVEHTTSQSETDSQTVVDSSDKTPKRPIDDGRSTSRKRQKISHESSSSDEKRRLDEFDFQENILFSQRKKRKRSAELYKEPERSVKSNLDDVSVQSHLTQARDSRLR